MTLLIQGFIFYHVDASSYDKKHWNCLYSYPYNCKCAHDNANLRVNGKCIIIYYNINAKIIPFCIKVPPCKLIGMFIFFEKSGE
ncbi:MAG: hypothetical protein JWQ54_2864 [Mucilaginibacter sp.]|nr:hypothetical protein [Mucilaginibacter sp.]